MTRRLLLLLALLATGALACNLGQSAATPTRPATAEPVAGTTATPTRVATATRVDGPAADTFNTYRNEELGLTFRYPSDWVLNEDEATIAVVSSAELLSADRLDQEGAGVLISTGDDEALLEETSSLEEALVEAIDRLALAEQQEIVEGPSTTTINGQEAAVATVAGRDEAGNPSIIFYVTLIHAQGRIALASGVIPAQEEAAEPATADRYRETLEAIATSIELTQPAGPVVEGSLSYGESGRGSVPEDGTSAWIFAGSAGDRIDITVEPLDPALDVTVDVLDSSGESVLAEGVVDDAFGTETVPRLLLEEADQYTILLGGFAGSTGEYRITLNEVTATGTGDAVLLAPNNSVVGEVGADETDTFLLTGVISQAVTIVVVPDPNFDVVVEQYGPEGALVASSDAGFEGQAERLSFTAQGGNVQVRGYTGAAGGYTITLVEGSPETAGTTILVFDALGEAEEHLYPFFAVPGELVTALVEPEEELDVVVEVWNEDDESRLETTDLSYTEEQVYFLPPAAGNYSLRVYGFEGATGTYTLTLQGTAATIFELAPGDQVTGRLPQGEALEYLLRPDPNAAITINAEGDAGTDVTLAVEDLDGSLLATVDEAGAGEAETLRFDAPAGSAGDVFLLRVEAFSGRAGTYTLSYE